MGDGAKAITKAGFDIFSKDAVKRLMCWSHTHRNILPQLKSVTAHNKDVSNNILKDIVDLQWSVLNDASFYKVFGLLEEKYLGKYDNVFNGVLAKFFSYMHKVWIDSEEHRWYEGAHPWNVSNNQGVEGCNKEIKAAHTFRRRLELGELMSVLGNMVEEWSEESDNLLESNRLEGLQGEVNSLSLRTEGYQWYKQNTNTRDKIVRIKSNGKYTVSESEEFNLGKVANLWAVNSEAGLKSGVPLKERAKERLAQRELPSSKDFDEFLRIRSSCWILEERDGIFYCDCPVGMKVLYMSLYIVFYFSCFRANYASIVWDCCT